MKFGCWISAEYSYWGFSYFSNILGQFTGEALLLGGVPTIGPSKELQLDLTAAVFYQEDYYINL